MSLLLPAFLIGIVAGLRAMTAPAAIAWGAYLGWFDLSPSLLSFMGSIWAVGIFTILALVELVTDQLPSTPSRKVPQQFAARLVTGALAGATVTSVNGSILTGLIAGILGAVIGTYGGAAGRGMLARAFGRDLPAALIEDVIAIGGAALVAAAVS